MRRHSTPRGIGVSEWLVFGSLATSATAALAQTSVVADAAPVLATMHGTGAPASEGELGEVVVTAQRRVERLQDVPISAQVIGGQSLTLRNLNSLTSVAQTVPAVHISTNGRTNDMYIRGIGSGGNQSFDQSVGMFIDDVYHGRSRISGATFIDLDRVEILKGPQSTFFGNNAIAGAVNIESRKPGTAFEANARALYGEDGQYALEGAVGGPLTETFSARLAMTGNGQRGWIDNVALGRHVPTENNLGGRLTFAFRPNEDFDAILKIEGSRNRGTGGPVRQIIDCPASPPFAASAGFCAQLLGAGFGNSTGIDANATADSPGQALNLDTEEYVLSANYERWNHILTSVSAYYAYDFVANFDSDGLPPFLISAQIPETYHQFSQELRIASPTRQMFEYMAGLYFQTDDLAARQNGSFFFLSVPSTHPLFTSLPLGQTVSFRQDEKSYAAFASLAWNLSPRLKLSAGLRGTRVDKDFDFSLRYGTATQLYGGIVPLPGQLNSLPAAATSLQGVASGLGLGRAGVAGGNRRDKKWLPSAKAQYQLTPEAMAYLSYSKGFKAGGFNGFDNTGDPANFPFAPEEVNAYEAGLKSEWLDKRVLLNLAVFRMDYRDQQVAQSVSSATFAGLVSVVRNAASSRSQGVEMEARWVATPNLRVTADVAYNDAHYESYTNVTLTSLQTFCRANATNATCLASYPGGVRPVQDLSGRPTMFAPRWSGTLASTYGVSFEGDYRFITELSGHASSAYYVSNEDDDNLRQGSFARLDGRLTLEMHDARFAIDLIGRNLTDRNILLIGNPFGTSLGSYRVSKQQPRNVALQVRYRW